MLASFAATPRTKPNMPSLVSFSRLGVISLAAVWSPALHFLGITPPLPEPGRLAERLHYLLVDSKANPDSRILLPTYLPTHPNPQATSQA